MNTKDKRKAQRKAYYERNRDRMLAYQEEYRARNRDKILVYQKDYHERNREKVCARMRDTYARNINKRRTYKKDYGIRNRNKISNYRRNKLKNDIQYRLRDTLRSRLYQAIRNTQKSGSAIRDLGCTASELKTHLENQFQEDMRWDNWGRSGWHIDHLIPISSFDLTDREQLKIACHYTNLQPLWAKENINKSNKLSTPQR